MFGSCFALALVVVHQGLGAHVPNGVEPSTSEGCTQSMGPKVALTETASLLQLGLVTESLPEVSRDVHRHVHEGKLLDVHKYGFTGDVADRSVEAATWNAIRISSMCIVSVVAIMGSWAWRPNVSPGQTTESQQREAGKSMLLDNAKWIAQFLVIYNHLMYYGSIGAMEDTKSFMLGAEPTMRYMNAGFSFLVNPFFCFISGVVSQGAPNPRRILRFVQYLVIPTLIWHFVVEFLFHDPMEHLNPSLFWHRLHPQVFGQHFIQSMSYCPAWYLFALCLWRGSVYLLWAHLPKPVAFAGMVVVSCYGGYYKLPNYGEHGFNAALAYLPCFGAGFVFPFQEVTRAIPKPTVMLSTCITCAVAAYCFILMPYFAETYIHLPDGHSWYGSETSGGKDFLAADSWVVSFWWCRRIIKVSADMFAVLVLLFLVLPRSELPVTYIGSHTLYSYLFHGLMFGWKTIALRTVAFPIVTSAMGHAVGLVCYIPLSFLTLAFFTSSYFRAFFKWALTPDWLNPLFKAMLRKLEKTQDNIEVAGASSERERPVEAKTNGTINDGANGQSRSMNSAGCG